MIGDRDKLYTSQFFKSLFHQLGTTLNLSTAAHPQTDGQSEITNKTIEQILRSFCYANQAQWLYHLPLAEFSYNNTESSTTGFSPFYSCYGYHPKTPINLSSLTPTIDVLENIQTVHSLIHENIKIAKAFQKHYHDKHVQTPPTFSVTDKVILSTSDLLIRGQQCPKLKQKYVGPFTITEIINPQVYKLDLPPELECHPVFHTSKLRPWDTDTCTSDIPDPLVGRTVSFPTSPVIHMIVDCKIGPYQRLYQRGTSLLLKVRYTGLPPNADEWLPYELLMHSPLFTDFAKGNTFFTMQNSDTYQLHKSKYPRRFH